eukprot:1416016-Pleurochrysis_carterae.AAC.3
MIFKGAVCLPSRTCKTGSLFACHSLACSASQPCFNLCLCAGTPPTDRRYHTTAAVGQRVFIFGGEFYDKGASSVRVWRLPQRKADIDTLEGRARGHRNERSRRASRVGSQGLTEMDTS